MAQVPALRERAARERSKQNLRLLGARRREAQPHRWKDPSWGRAEHSRCGDMVTLCRLFTPSDFAAEQHG